MSLQAAPLYTVITYQASLSNFDDLPTDDFDFQFGLWNALAGGVQLGPTVALEDVAADGPASDVGSYSAIKIAGDGLLVISYRNETQNKLMVAKCGNRACVNNASTITTADTSTNVGRYSSMVIGNDGISVISYYDLINNSLKVSKCASPSCQ